MLKRLLIAVFVFGLVLAFSGTAISDVSKGELNPVVKINPNAELYDGLSDARPAQPSFKKPESALEPISSTVSPPSPPLEYFCDAVDYSGAPAYFWKLPDAYGDDLFNVRFTSEVNFNCTLKVAHFLMYGTAMKGTPDMRVYLWDDDGFGFPGNKLDSVDIPYADLPTSGLAYVSADFSSANWVFSNGAEYHYGFSTLQSGPGDTLAIISDAGDGPTAGEARSSEYWGTWGTMLNDYGGDYCFQIVSEVCNGEIPFSECYSIDLAQNLAYYWKSPHPTYNVHSYSQRYDVSGPDTLVSVDFAVYNPANGTFGNDDIIITISEDDGGFPGTVIASATLPAGTYPAFPSMATANFGIIVPGTFHVTFNSSAIFPTDYESCLSSDGTDGTGRSSCMYGGDWYTMADLWGDDVNFLFTPNLCRDPYNVCVNASYYVGLSYYWNLPDAYGDVAQAQRISTTGIDCQVNEVTWYLYDFEGAAQYTANSKVSVYTDVAGFPGTELASVTLTPTDYVLFPAATTVDFHPLDVYVTGDYWIVIESFAATEDEGIATLSDWGGSGRDNQAAEYYGVWGYLGPDWGGPADVALVAEASHCCIPFEEASCDPVNDDGWWTLQGGFGRTGTSDLAVGDAWCNLNLNWSYEDPTQGVAFTGPAIYGDRAVCAFTTHYTVFNITDGSIVYTLTSALGDGQVIGLNIRHTPTIMNIEIGGIPTDVMFLTGGSTNSIAAINFNTGALIWARTILNVGPTGLFGLTRFAPITVLNIGGTWVAYFGTDAGKVAAVDATTGAKFPGWATNPVVLTGNCYISGASDGTSLFYATQSGSAEGDVYSIDAATGVINWTLSGSGGLQAQNIYTHEDGYLFPEGFRAGVAYDNGQLFTVSYANEGGISAFPTDGIFYIIDAGSGALAVPAVAGNRSQYSTPIVDANRVICPTLPQWASAPAGGALVAYNKFSGTQDWAVSDPAGSVYYNNGFRTCEPDGVDDLIFLFNSYGFLECWNSVSGQLIFNRRVDHGASPNSMGGSGAIAMASDGLHIMFSDYWGSLYDLTQGAERPRMQIVTYNPTYPVDFGTDPNLAINVGPIIENTGCVDLLFTNVYLDENSFGVTIPSFKTSYVRDATAQTAAKLADELTATSKVSINPFTVTDFDNDDFDVRETSTSTLKGTTPSLAGVPAWIAGIDHPVAGDLVAPGGSIDLQLRVNQPNISRGPQVVYIAFETNDPDFFLNDPAALPQVMFMVVGGCLVDTTTLYFGTTGTNEQLVTNTGRLGDGNWGDGDAGYNGFLIDGNGAYYYQGSYIYGVDKYRIAVNVGDWWSNTDGEFISLQADPNYCDVTCKPYLDAGVQVGSITRDGGLTYDPIMADVVCKSWLDSVQNFDLDPDPLSLDWSWQYNYVSQTAPFDDTLTMGLYVTSRVIGVTGVPELANLTLEIMNFQNRNAVDLPNWYFAHMWDCDLGTDTVGIDRSISTVWAYNRPSRTRAWGQVKVPFGCGDASNGNWDFEPAINVLALYTFSGSDNYYDSAYLYMTYAPGDHSQKIGTQDTRAHFTLAGHDFGPSGTYSMAVANFGLFNLTNASSSAEIAPTSILVNKWAGFGRGDVNDDGTINLADIVYLAGYVNRGGPGPIPFDHLGDVNADGATGMADVNYLINYYFNCGPCPMGDWAF